jgi:hypothetical protein
MMLLEEPCPYCGGALEVARRRFLLSLGDGQAVLELGPVRCRNCGASSDNEDDDPSGERVVA